MDENPEICEACLTKDRQLVLLDIIRPVIVYLDVKELLTSQGCICWECYTTIIKFNKFRRVAKNVQEILARQSQHKKSYSNLGIKIIKHYDYQFEYIEPNIIENDTTDPILIKQEPENDFDNGETAFVDVIECKKDKNLPNKRLTAKRLAIKRLSKDKLDLPQQFQMVLLTEEKYSSKSMLKDKSIDPEELQTVMSTGEIFPKDMPDGSEELTTKRLPSKRLSSKRSDDSTYSSNKEQVKLTEDNSKPKSLSTRKRLSTKMSEDLQNLTDKSEQILLPKGTSKTKSLPVKRLSRKRLSIKILEDPPDSSDNFEQVVLTEDKPESNSLPTKRLTKKRLSTKDTPDLSYKFEMVTLTDEEVTRMREEKRNHHNYKKLPYKCDYCVLGFTKKDNYDYHMTSKHDECKGERCDVCSIRFNNLVVLNNHRCLHYQYFRCKLCEYKGNTHMAIINHVTDKHKEDTTDKIHCKLCTQWFRSREEITEHIKTDHTLYCNECGEKFKTKGSLRLHLKRLHTIKREFICPDCKKTFLTRSRLETHMTRHSTTLAKRLAYCAICRIQYKDLAIYRSHLRNSLNHVQEKFPCPDCDKKFASKAYWKKHHNFYHLKKSQHKCEECDKIFISYFLLKGHRQKYHGLSRPRNHSCSVCQKSFYNITNLRAHMQIHSSHRAYMCAKCGDTFKQRPALYTHQRLVHTDHK